MKSAKYTELRGSDRSVAHLAAVARVDTICGGAKALAYAKRLERMGSQIDPVGVVGDVYSLSSGKWHTVHEGWFCPECGRACLGITAAAECCQEGVAQESGCWTWNGNFWEKQI